MIATLTTWIATNPLYVLVGLVGLVLGIFYGFDGWNGDTKDKDFKDTPRAKNLIWVLGGGFTAFVGDLDSASNKILTLLAYFVPCAAAAATVVIFWGIVVALSRLWATWTKQTHGYRLADAVGDYFYYGYRHYRKKSEAVETAAVFHRAYIQQMSAAVMAAGSATAAKRNDFVRQILRTIAAVVKSYHRDEQNQKGIRANLMQVKNCDDKLRARLQFVGENRAETARCLELITYEDIEETDGIVLPLPGSTPGARVKALPGAPTAYVDRWTVIDDTSKIGFSSGVAQDIQNEQKKYFEQHAFKSVGSVPIIQSGTIIGIVNVEATVLHVFGESEDEKDKVVKFLLPFCAALAIVISNV